MSDYTEDKGARRERDQFKYKQTFYLIPVSNQWYNTRQQPESFQSNCINNCIVSNYCVIEIISFSSCPDIDTLEW